MPQPSLLPFDLARELGHERLLIAQRPEVGLTAVIALHDTTLGPAVGGTRMRAYEDLGGAVADALRLSSAMTAKAAFANLPFGGGKAVLVGDPRRDKSEALLEAYGGLVEELGGRFFTGGDMGIEGRDLEVISRQTRHVGHTPANAGVDASDLTAIGVLAAMETVADRLGRSLADCTVAIQGLGEVGGRLALRLADAGARLVVADIDRERLVASAQQTGARVVAPEEILEVECDLLSPNAAGGVVTWENASRLQCRAIVGAANNPLASPELAAILLERGVLYAPDFVVNAGGLLSVLFETGALDEQGVVERVRRIGSDLEALLERATTELSTPLAVARAVVRERLEAARAAREAAAGV